MASANSNVCPPSKVRVSVIIPTINEQYGIEKTLTSILRSGLNDESKGYDLEILVVDGGSFDQTANVASKMGARVIFEKRRGYGRSLKTGFAEARGEIIATLDADDTYPADFLLDYVKQLKEKDVDFISINRFFSIDNGAMDFSHRIGNNILTMLTNFLFSLHIKDSQSGMWIMKKSFLSRINLQSNGMSISEEIKIIAYSFFDAVEVDGKYYRKRVGKSKVKLFQDGLRNLGFLVLYKKQLKFALKPSQIVPELR
jgi:dolichol-phosphate hexosyltransferase